MEKLEVEKLENFLKPHFGKYILIGMDGQEFQMFFSNNIAPIDFLGMVEYAKMNCMKAKDGSEEKAENAL